MAFVASPAAVFFSVPYSESLFAALAFGGVAMLAQRRPWAATAHFALAACTRANGCLFAFVLLFDSAALGLSLPRARWPGFALATTARLGLVAAPPMMIDALSFRRWCVGPRPLWCEQAWPSLYAHVQNTHWGVGFRGYWKLRQLPNFFLAAPALLIAGHAASNCAPI